MQYVLLSSLMLHPCHLAAFIRALAADVSAFLAMGILEHRAFLRALVTDLCAHLAMLLGELSVHCHCHHGHLAHHRAFHEHMDAILAVIQIWFIDACIKALIAGYGTLVTRIDAALILVWYNSGWHLEIGRDIRCNTHRVDSFSFP